MQKLSIFAALLILTVIYAFAANEFSHPINFDAGGNPVYGSENRPNGSASSLSGIEFPLINWNERYSYPNWTGLGMSCVDDSGYLYGLGGRYPDNANCYRFNVTTNTWTYIAQMPGTNANQYAVFWKDNTPGALDSSCILVLSRYTYPPQHFFKNLLSLVEGDQYLGYDSSIPRGTFYRKHGSGNWRFGLYGNKDYRKR